MTRLASLLRRWFGCRECARREAALQAGLDDVASVRALEDELLARGEITPTQHARMTESAESRAIRRDIGLQAPWTPTRRRVALQAIK